MPHCANTVIIATDLNSDICSLSDLPTLQRQCTQPKPIIDFLENGDLPEDEKLAKRITLEQDEYVIENGILRHLFTSRTRDLAIVRPIIKQVTSQSRFGMTYCMHIMIPILARIIRGLTELSLLYDRGIFGETSGQTREIVVLHVIPVNDQKRHTLSESLISSH